MAIYERDNSVEQVLEKAAHLPEFSEEERKALQQVAYYWKGLEAFGRMAMMLKTVLIYVGWAIAIYLLIKGNIIDFIRGVK